MNPLAPSLPETVPTSSMNKELALAEPRILLTVKKRGSQKASRLQLTLKKWLRWQMRMNPLAPSLSETVPTSSVNNEETASVADSRQSDGAKLARAEADCVRCGASSHHSHTSTGSHSLPAMRAGTPHDSGTAEREKILKKRDPPCSELFSHTHTDVSSRSNNF
ncbi:hypothetical protein Bbelb_228660 [Branchiostoma belcheri]|nr:hypothetical protein Bbelb_228660 [Branchiostoma belcheri]